MEKVIVGLSGGVDSAVAAYLLKQQGYDVTGVTLRTWEGEDGAYSRCCDIDDARATAFRIGIPYYPVNCVATFREQVVDRFVEDYLKGVTPNPCVVCNKCVKWEKLLHYADVVGAKYVATGHYAYVEKLGNGRWTVRKALHAEKDQTYMLYRLSQEQLSRTLMPLGGMSKEEVRRIAEEAGLPVASKPDSQEVCFVTSGSYAEYVERTAKPPLPGEGNFVDEDGRVLGRHRGIHHYTVGQRKGLGIAWAHPLYVKEIDPERNEVVLGTDASLYVREVRCGELNFLGIAGLAAGEKLPCRAKVRYQHDTFPAVLEAKEDGTALLTFDEPVRAAAPGQSAVFYDEEDRVIGGGVILRR